MPDAVSSFFFIPWAALIVSVVMCGIWVIFSIRKTLVSTLVFDLLYTGLLMAELVNTMASQGTLISSVQQFITLVTFFLNFTLTSVIFIEWRFEEDRINQYVLWLKIAVAIIGIYTVIPLSLYYLRLSFLPRYGPLATRSRTGSPGSSPVSLFPQQDQLPGQAAPALASPPPQLAGQYSDWVYIGRGGFARVFRVKRKDGTQVALKVPLVHDPATGKTFIAELQNWTRLTQENIVRVLDFNILPVPYVEMELCDSSLAGETKPLHPHRAAEYLFDICEGLRYCHASGIIHRDLKPSNILFRDGILKISDWGLSKVLSEAQVTSSQVSFSPGYAAPEQVLGKAKDARTDIWQTGVIFYELVAGILPFRGDNLVEELAMITTRDPAPPSDIVPDAGPLDGIIMKCLEKHPEDRYPSAEDLQRDIAGYLKKGYTDLLNRSISRQDPAASAVNCGRLLLISLKSRDLAEAFRYATELGQFTRDGRGKAMVARLLKQIPQRMAEDPPSVPSDLVQDVRSFLATLGEGGLPS